ncbi:MAG: FtsW/RodA/SpoVE family cell cycle protein [Planctomycetota bacterium]|nr:FtsW/RodA/SpoVE family cell cycle protein [Planctomycetota bacterium]
MSRFATTSVGSSARSGVLGVVFAVLNPANPAWLVVLASLGLSLVGIAAIDFAQTDPGDVTGAVLHSGVAWKQAVFLGVGMLAALVVALPHYRFIGAVSGVFMAVAIGLLVFVLLPFVPAWLVTPRNGARGWINLGIADLQPAEFAKIAYVLVMARYLRYRDNHRTLIGLLPPAVITGVPVALITLEPDLGSALLFVPSLFAMLVAAGAKLRHLTLIVLMAALAAPAAYPFLKPHQKARIVGLWHQIRGDTSLDQDINYQAATAQTLIGSGELTGVEGEKGRAIVHYSRLPERHNDMIFAVITSRHGMLGAIVVLGLYLVWIVGALGVSASTRDPFGRIVGVGFAGFIAAQVFINVGMNVGLVPIIGVTLPFVSYGGSSLLTVWIMTGLLFSIALRRPRGVGRHSFEFGEED